MKENIGKYVSQAGYSDVNIIGKIVGVKGKRTYLVQEMDAVRQLTKLDFSVGGFSGHCSNQDAQKWEFRTSDSVIEVKSLKNSRLVISENPFHYYDYNF